MKNNILLNDILCCPECKENLDIIVKNDTLSCKNHGKYKIVEDIPSFVNDQKFDKHWEDNFCKDIPQMKLDVAKDFLNPMFEYKKSKNELVVLDAGCGDGVHTEVISRNFRDFNYIGCDISNTALKIAKQRHNVNSGYVHCDISKLPFKDNLFDIVFSFGVLAYTDNPAYSFSELCRVTKKGGALGIWILPRITGFVGDVLNGVRKFCKITGPIGSNFIANCIVPFLGVLPTRSKLSLKEANWKQCREIVLVNIAPDQLVFPEQNEIRTWFEKNKIKINFEDENEPITLWGIKT